VSKHSASVLCLSRDKDREVIQYHTLQATSLKEIDEYYCRRINGFGLHALYGPLRVLFHLLCRDGALKGSLRARQYVIYTLYRPWHRANHFNLLWPHRVVHFKSF
jgi:hypothetical protein